MTTVGRVSVGVPVRAPVGAVWDAVTDWAAQGAWIPATRVRAVDGDGRGVGGRIEAFTGLGRVGFLDTMVVTEWRPPTWCAVEHTGRVVRGAGAFRVTPTPDGAVFTWSEDLRVPGGALGGVGWRLVSPFVRLAVRRALTRLAHSIEAGQDAQPAAGSAPTAAR
jgi:carbon monoxide dehydrogenase subunit G